MDDGTILKKTAESVFRAEGKYAFILQRDALALSLNYIIFEVFTAVTMKNGVFWNVMRCGSCKNRRFGGTYCLFHQGYAYRI
jgi:hypothetical protein